MIALTLIFITLDTIFCRTIKRVSDVKFMIKMNIFVQL